MGYAKLFETPMVSKSRPLLPIFLIVFVDVLAFTLVLPYLPFFAERYGASPLQVGSIITVFALCQFLSGPVLGRMSDQMGRKPILMLSQMGTCLGFIILALSQNLWMVYLARILDGITAGNLTVAQAAISDVTKPSERSKAFALIGVSFGLGFFVGPAISAGLLHFGTQAPAWGAAGISFLSIITTFLFFADSAEVRASKVPFHLKFGDLAEGLNFKPIIRYFNNPKLKPLLLQYFFFNLSFSAHISCFALFAERRLNYDGHPFGPKEVSYLYAYLGFLGIIIRSAVIQKLIQRFGERITSRIGFLAQGLGFAGYAFVHTIPGALIAATVGSLGSGIIRPTLSALLSRVVGAKEQGSLFGVSQSLAAIASIIAPLAAGYLIGHASATIWAIFTGTSILLALLINPKALPENENYPQGERSEASNEETSATL
jgi:DHA1 family tetracycline resistance protein-like MFS transporter